MSKVTRLQTRVETMWDRYIAAKERADFTDQLEDGIAAARTWRAWLEQFMSDEQIAYLDEKTGERREG